MSVTHKAVAMAREVANRLTIRMATDNSALTVTSGVDTSGNPTLTINDGSAATTEQNIFIRFTTGPAPLGTDSVGNTQNSYGPHVAQVALEEHTTTGLVYVKAHTMLTILAELARMGFKLELYLEDNATVPSVSSIDADHLVGSFDDLYFPLTGTV